MKAAIVTIGDEILIGQIIDTNSGFIAKSLDKIGVETTCMLSISDDKQDIFDTFFQLQNKVNLVVVTGGLGPTKDDVTKKTFCEYFEDELVVDQSVLDHVTQLIEGVFKKPITQINKDQALVPSRCTVLPNEVGTAPGMWMQKGDTVFVSLPGVPFEMKHLIEKQVIPKVVEEFERPYIIHQSVMTYGLGESLLAERIESWEDNLPDFIKLAYLPSPGSVKLRLTARGVDQDILKKELALQLKSLDEIIHDVIVGFEEGETLEVSLLKRLKLMNATLATAESCTGGKIASTITAVPGSSLSFKGSVVSYATEAKINVLEIDEKLIEKHSVVSAEVVREMALSAQKIFDTEYALATTGNAGPQKGDSNAEVGTVFIALATPNEVLVEGFNFGQPREKVIDRATVKALEMLQKEILKNVH